MNPRFHCFRWRAGTLRRLWDDDRASQIVEFALSLPLLVLFVVGIFDFSGAISLKQKLTNAAREAARVRYVEMDGRVAGCWRYRGFAAFGVVELDFVGRHREVLTEKLP